MIMLKQDMTERQETVTDESLMRAVNAGDSHALAELAKRHYRLVAGIAYRMLGRADAAEDAAQDVFVKLAGNRAGFAGRASFKTWLTRIVLNLCIDYRRRNRDPRPLSEEIPDRDRSLPAASDQRYVSARIEYAISQLPERQRTALILHRYDNQSYKQIAAATGWSESAVESLIMRAYATLRDELRDLQDF